MRLDFVSRNQSLEPAPLSNDPVRYEMSKSRLLQLETQNRTHTDTFGKIASKVVNNSASQEIAAMVEQSATDIELTHNEFHNSQKVFQDVNVHIEDQQPRGVSTITHVDQMRTSQQELLKDRLLELGSVQQEDEQHQLDDQEPDRLQSDLQKLSASVAEEGALQDSPSQQKSFDAVNNKNLTHDQRVFSLEPQLLQKNGSGIGTSN